jgi:hypothetical protein
MKNKLNIDPVYVPFFGSALNTVSEVLQNGDTFASAAKIMSMRSKALRLNDGIAIEGWCEDSFLALNPIFYAKNGNVKFGDINDSRVMDYVKQITPAREGNLYKGRMILLHDFNLSDISGVEFTRNDIALYGNKLQSEKSAKSNIFLNVLSNHDQTIQEEYIERAYKFIRDKYGQKQLMSINFSNCFEKNSVTLFLVDYLGYKCNSSFNSNISLERDSQNIIRVREIEGQSPVIQGGNIVTPTLQQILEIENNDNLSKNDRIKSIRELYLKK